MAYVIWVEFTVKPEWAGDFIPRVQQQARDSLNNENGCHRFDVCLDPNDPCKIALYEIYADAAAFQTHLTTDHFKSFDQTVREWLEDKRVSQYGLISESAY